RSRLAGALTLCFAMLAARAAGAGGAGGAASLPVADSIVAIPRGPRAADLEPESQGLSTPFGDPLLPALGPGKGGEGRGALRFQPVLSYSRVDPLRAGAAAQWMPDETWVPRIGARFEYAFGRERGLYGIAVEQPLDAARRLALTASAVRITDHSELQQVEDIE